MYADKISGAMDVAIKETERRRGIQDAYNKAHGITPTTVKKSVRAVIEATRAAEPGMEDYKGKSPLELTKKELADYVKKLEKEMKQAAVSYTHLDVYKRQFMHQLFLVTIILVNFPTEHVPAGCIRLMANIQVLR